MDEPIPNREFECQHSSKETFSNDEIDPRPPEFTDDALALRFAEYYALELRYVATWGRWYIWDGMKWQRDETLMSYNNARKVCREAGDHCNEVRVAWRISSAVTVAAVERLARSDRRLAATVDQWDAHNWLLNTPGEVIDLRTGEMRRHDPLEYFTKITSVAPAGQCETWQAFLDRVTQGDSELKDYLQRMAGYAITGDTSEQALFFLYGTGANGKSVFIETLAGLLGDYQKTAPIETFTTSSSDRHPTDLARLRGARLVSAIETEEGRQLSESRVKQLTGGDRVAARFNAARFLRVHAPVQANHGRQSQTRLTNRRRGHPASFSSSTICSHHPSH